MTDNTDKKLAVLIDADNVQASVAPKLLAEVAKYGVASVKRAYGDWTTSQLGGWKDHLHKHAIQPMQQFGYTVRKNATDSFLIIDAMDLLHEGNLDGFCLVSSDSDFTRLATRIRESGLTVFGFGEEKTPEAFRSACDKFVYMEILGEKKTDMASSDVDLRNALYAAINAVSRDDEWAALAAVGAHINKNDSSFDSRNYGFEKLGKLVESLNYIEIDKRVFDDKSNASHIYIKMKNNQ